MKIYLNVLKEASACEEQIALFERYFGESVELTLALCIKHKDDFNFNWYARQFFTPAAWAVYEEAKAPAWAVYEEAKAPARAAYEKAVAAAWAVYEEAKAPAYAAYKKAEALACAAYEEARAPAWAAYEEAVAAAFFIAATIN
jgi:hypothetical protein